MGVLAVTALLVWVPSLPGGADNGGRAVLTPREGGSSTRFTLRLPSGASCPGDSADDGYRVNSYMVPAAVDPATVTFDGLGPTPPSFGEYAAFREPLFDIDTNSFVSAQTADAEGPDEPGTIVNIPDFSFAVYKPGDLPAGRYHVGIACTLLNESVRIWDTEVVVSEAGDDEPAQIRWRGVDGASGERSGSALVPVALIAIAVVLVLVLRRRRKPRPITAHMEET